MLITYIVLGFAFAIPELIVVYNWPWLKRQIENNPIAELVFSLGLSVVLAAAMGVGAGVTLAVANVMSTLITLAVYHLHIVENYRALRTNTKAVMAQVHTNLSEITDLIDFMWKIFMFPIQVTFAILRFFNRGAAAINRRGTHV